MLLASIQFKSMRVQSAAQVTEEKAGRATIPRQPSVSIAPSYSAAQFSYVARTCASSSLIFLPPSGFLADSSARKSMHIQCRRPLLTHLVSSQDGTCCKSSRHASTQHTSAQQTTCAIERLVHDLERSFVLAVLLHTALELSVGRRRVEEPATHRDARQPSRQRSGNPLMQAQGMRDARTQLRKYASTLDRCDRRRAIPGPAAHLRYRASPPAAMSAPAAPATYSALAPDAFASAAQAPSTKAPLAKDAKNGSGSLPRPAARLISLT